MLTIGDIKEKVLSSERYRPKDEENDKLLFSTIKGIDKQIEALNNDPNPKFPIFYLEEQLRGLDNINYEVMAQWFDKQLNPVERPSDEEKETYLKYNQETDSWE